MGAQEGEWSTRGYLPHYKDGTSIQAITYRLADSLPREVLRKIEQQKVVERGEFRRRAEIDAYLDFGYGGCLLARRTNAEWVLNNWLEFAGRRYFLHAFVIMPNHVHVMIEPLIGHSVAEIVHSWKSYTAKKILKSAGLQPALFKMAGEPPALPQVAAKFNKQRPVWQKEYWDRFIRNESHYYSAIEYIHQNPVKAGLVRHVEDWPWSSAASDARVGVPPTID